MEITCQRCNETLREQDRYCPSCGLPQLIHVPAELPVVALGSDLEPGSHAERLDHGGAHFQIGGHATVHGIAWRPALRAALFLAVPAGILCSNVSIIGPSLTLVWMVGAAVWAVALYGRRLRPGRLTKAVGARIGLITGVFACWLTLGINGLWVWASRFVFHQNARMDTEWQSFVDQAIQIDKGFYAQMGMNSGQMMQQLAMQRALMLSAEGRAGFPLLFFLTSAVFLILFSTLGGAVGARFVTPASRPRT